MRSDADIKDDVIEELKWTPDVVETDIGVSVKDGIVTLSGTVPRYSEKWAAEKAAQRVKGVKAIVEEMKVKLAGSLNRSDEDIARSITNALEWHANLPKDLKVKVEAGWVTLSGDVEYGYQRSLAYDAVRFVSGVKGITNSISISPKVQPDEVKKKITKALHRLAQEEAEGIEIETSGSKVVLSGTVHSIQELNDVKWAAWAAPGVSDVESRVAVL